MTQDDLQNERHRMVRLAMDLIERRGTDITRVTLASEAQISRARIESISLFLTETSKLHPTPQYEQIVLIFSSAITDLL